MKKSTITIGIAAYNEEKNIGSLLKSLLSQRQTNFLLQSIIVVSDGSTDKTVYEIKKLRRKNIVIRDNKNRQGKSAALNEILKKVSSDVLVFMDADVVIKDKLFLQKLINPILQKKADLTTAKVMELPVKNTFQKMLLLSMNIKKEIFELYKNGENIYTCHGRSLALGKKIYKKMQFPEGMIADDAYIYMFCITKKFIYQYVKEAKVFYALPSSNEDHQKQSHRFLSTQKQLYKIFGEAKTKSEYYLPKTVFIKVVMRHFLKNPMLLLRYGFVYARSSISALIKQPPLVQWETAHSSKTI